MIDSFNPPPNSITLCLESDKPIIVVDEIGFKYKEVLIEDAGEVYKLFKEFLRSAQNTEQEISDEQLENILHTSGRHDTPYHKDSIMSYGKICEHDNGYLCEHRRQYIISLFEKKEISDEEIESAAVLKYRGDNFAKQRANSDKILAFEDGAKWYREQLKNK